MEGLNEKHVHDHLLGAIAAGAVVAVFAGLRVWIACRRPAEQAGSWVVQLVRSQIPSLALAAVVVYLTYKVVDDINTLVSAINNVVAYPDVVLADLEAVDVASLTQECALVFEEAKALAKQYEVPEFDEFAEVKGYAWVPTLVWVAVLTIFIAATPGAGLFAPCWIKDKDTSKAVPRLAFAFFATVLFWVVTTAFGIAVLLLRGRCSGRVRERGRPGRGAIPL